MLLWRNGSNPSNVEEKEMYDNAEKWLNRSNGSLLAAVVDENDW